MPGAPGLGDDTLRHYKIYWLSFANWLELNYPSMKCLCEVTSEIAQKYAAQINSRGLSANTYNIIYADFARAFISAPFKQICCDN
jgi:hypothetical protein